MRQCPYHKKRSDVDENQLNAEVEEEETPTPLFTPTGLLIGVFVLALAVLSVYFAMRERPGGPTSRSTYDLKKFSETDPSIILCDESGKVATGFKRPECLALGPEGKIYVGGDRAVKILDSSGKVLEEIQMPVVPGCIAVDKDGRIYVGGGLGVAG